jgi:serpin B
MKQRILFAAVAALVMAATGCGGSGEDADFALVMSDAQRAAAGSAAPEIAAEAGAQLGFNILRELQGQGTNQVISPYSIQVALAMTRLGARGLTREEMDAVLGADGVTGFDDSLNALDQVLLGRAGEYDVDGGEKVTLELSTANSLWGQEGVSFHDTFLDDLATWYGAGMRLVDYTGATEEARAAINGWVSDQTRDRIPELLPAGSISPATVLVLTNAVYLNAPWLFPFDEADTRDGAFTRLDGSIVQVPLMQQTARLSFFQGEEFAAVELPYAGRGLAMLLLVPDSDAFTAIESTLDSALLAEIVAGLEQYEVTLAMPRFEFRTQAQLNDALAELGMPSAFDSGADFSGITADASLYISAVLHEAFISVNEIGTEAAAATAVILDESAAGQQAELLVDRPFMFFIRDTETGALLFAGKVTDPSAK